MEMSSEPRGIGTSTIEVTNITTHGVWLLAGERELFMPYSEFPFFRDVSVGKILNVEQATPGHFYWPDLDVDLGVETIENPDRFPLVASVEP
jgi:hypothetical protein